MTFLTVGTETYGVEFRHRTQRLSPHQKRPPGLSERAPVKGITTCVIVNGHQVGIGTALCVTGDNFSRRMGMDRSFIRAAGDCKLWDAEALFHAYNEQWPAKPVLPEAQRVVLSEERRLELVAAGAAKRHEREGKRARKAGGA